MALTLWHNPRCSTSRKALALLREHGLEPQIRLYLDDRPDADELRGLCRTLGLRPIDLVRRKEPDWAASGLGPGSDDSAILAGLAANPRLIERPILVTDKGAVIGRPAEAVLGLV